MDQVCCLTPLELRLYVVRGELPECANCNPDATEFGKHAHRKYREVERLVGNDDGSGSAIWIGGRFMAFVQRPKRWAAVERGGSKELGRDFHDRIIGPSHKSMQLVSA